MGGKNETPHANDSVRCLTVTTISLLAGKWTISIILALADGKRRFAALQRLLPGISHHVLAKELKRLQTHEIIVRAVYPTTPPSVEYELTRSGIALHTVLHAAAEWAANYLNKTIPAIGDTKVTR